MKALIPRSHVAQALIGLGFIMGALIISTGALGDLWVPVFALAVALVVELWTRGILK